MALEEGRRRTNDEQVEEQLVCGDEPTPVGLSAADAWAGVEKSRHPDLALTHEKLPLFEKDHLQRPPSRGGARDADKDLTLPVARTERPRVRRRPRAARWTCFWVLLVASILVHTGAYRTILAPFRGKPGPRPPLPPTNSSTAMFPPPSGSTGAVVPPYHNTTLGAPTPRPFPSAITSAGQPGPTAAPRSGPRHRISAMVADLGFGRSEIWVWSRTSNNTLVRRAMHRGAAAAWEDGASAPLLGAPVVAPAFTLGWDAHLAFAIEAETGDMAYALWQTRGGWQAGGAWTSLGGRRFAYQPTVAVGRWGVTVLAVAADGYLWANHLVRSHPGPGWGGWRVAGGGFAGEVAVAPVGSREHREHPVYLVGLKDGQYQAAWAPRGPFIYRALGVPGPCRGAELGWARLLQDDGSSPLQVFVACAGRVWNKAHDPATGVWDAEWRAFGDGPPGLRHLTHGQVATSDRLFSRASDGCVYHIGRYGYYGPNHPTWAAWEKLWCPEVPRNLTDADARTLSLAVAAQPKSQATSVIIEDVDGKLWYNHLNYMSFTSKDPGYAAQPFEPLERPE